MEDEHGLTLPVSSRVRAWYLALDYDQREAWSERAACYEYLGGYTRTAAELLAMKDEEKKANG